MTTTSDHEWSPGLLDRADLVLGALVRCSDKPAGTLVSVVVDPVAAAVTDLVVHRRLPLTLTLDHEIDRAMLRLPTDDFSGADMLAPVLLTSRKDSLAWERSYGSSRPGLPSRRVQQVRGSIRTCTVADRVGAAISPDRGARPGGHRAAAVGPGPARTRWGMLHSLTAADVPLIHPRTGTVVAQQDLWPCRRYGTGRSLSA